jgi:hypothetical protein
MGGRAWFLLKATSTGRPVGRYPWHLRAFCERAKTPETNKNIMNTEDINKNTAAPSVTIAPRSIGRASQPSTLNHQLLHNNFHMTRRVGKGMIPSVKPYDAH